MDDINRERQIYDSNIIQAFANNDIKPRFMNLSDVQLPERIEVLLKKGPKFTPNQGTNDIGNIKSKKDIQMISDQMTYLETKFSSIALNPEQKLDINIIQNSLLKNIQDKKVADQITDPNLIFTRGFLKNSGNTVIQADKAKIMVVIDINQYNNMMIETLKENNFVEIEKNPNVKNERKLQNIIRQLSELKVIDGLEYKRLYPSGCSTPNIFGTIKTHKDPMKMRPIVNASKSYCAELSKWVSNNIIKKYANRSFSVKNSMEVKKKLKSIKLDRDCYMISLDIVNMYSNIPKNIVIEYILSRYRFDRDKKIKLPMYLLNDILKICSDDIPALFNGTCYSQILGCQMGSSVSPIFAEIALFLILKEINKMKNLGIILMVNYADDLLLIIKNKNNVEKICEVFNGSNQYFKFTLEREENFILNFLDLKIIRGEHSFDFTVHRKDSQSVLRINYESNYDRHVKINAVNVEINRAFNLCSGDNFLRNELDFIKYIYTTNGYPLKLINQLISKNLQYNIKNNFCLNSLTGKYMIRPSDGAIVQSYNDSIDLSMNSISRANYSSLKVENNSYILANKLINICKKNGNWSGLENFSCTAGKQKNTFDMLKAVNKCPRNALDIQGIVYFVKCNLCEKASYVGESKRNVRTRIFEHRVNPNSPLYMHTKEWGKNHTFGEDLSCLRILYQESDEKKRKILEKLSIEFYKPELNLISR